MSVGHLAFRPTSWPSVIRSSRKEEFFFLRGKIEEKIDSFDSFSRYASFISKKKKKKEMTIRLEKYFIPLPIKIMLKNWKEIDLRARMRMENVRNDRNK